MLSKKCQYAIHALIYLTEKHEKECTTIVEIADAKSIPHKFLEVILLDLKNAGVLGSKKGKGGGYYMIKHADQIRIIDVIRLIDGAVAMLPCVSLNFYESCGLCENEKKCSINKLFKEVRDATLKILSNNTIGDLARIHRS
ncbi:MAG: Rrf2 family transcriptional regulator [Cyclobacteriaceae bacterium]|nr:Rrf2 family transcriptional regulator [Cyclobacteriaceae bacterium]